MSARRDADRSEARSRRHTRVRTRVAGTPVRPRLCVYRSEKHLYAQVIDDTTGRVLVGASTLSPEVRPQGRCATVAAASAVGAVLAARARGRGITKVVFDRGGYRFHGRVAALAEAARAAGMEF